jgi:hypothetical protein
MRFDGRNMYNGAFVACLVRSDGSGRLWIALFGLFAVGEGRYLRMRLSCAEIRLERRKKEMTTPFGMSNGNKEGGTEGKTYLVSPSSKENFPTNLFPVSTLPANNTVMSQTGEAVGYKTNVGHQRVSSIRFAEPYSPQRNEFQAVPIAMGIEFVNVATGPPWSIGDTIENIRRRELDRTQPPQTQLPQLQPFTPQSYDPATNYAATNLLHLSNSNTTIADTILSLMEPTAEVLEYARVFTHLTISNDVIVPLTYIRMQIPQIYKTSFLNLKTSTHILQLTDLNGQVTTVPIHDLVFVAQCLEIRNRVALQPQTYNTGILGDTGQGMKPVLNVVGVPHFESFGVLLRWLYENDEDGLYETLDASRGNGDGFVLGFAQNCRFWGVIDARVTGVVRALFDGQAQVQSYQ